MAKPVAERYGWAVSPQGNLKVAGKPSCPLPSFRTDSWNFPESEDPEVSAVEKAESKARSDDAASRLETRKLEEAKQAMGLLERLKKLGVPEVTAK